MCAAGLLAACTPNLPAPFTESAAAIVDGHAIPIKDYEARLEVSRHRDPLAGIEAVLPSPAPAQRLEDFTIAQLVREEIVRGEAERRGVKVAPGEAGERVATLRRRAPAGEFDGALSRNGFTAQSFEGFQRALLTEVALVRAMAKERAVMADQALDSGRSFAAVAGQWSDDAGTFQRGGEVGWLKPVDLPEPELAAALLPVEPRGRTGIVQTRRGFVIATVKERRQDQVHLAVIVVLAPSADLYTPDSRPRWFDRYVEARLGALTRAGRIDIRVGSHGRG